MKKIYRNFFSGSYQITNGILAGFVILIFLYSAIFSPERNNYPIHSSETFISGNYSMSTGLSRGFSSIMRLQFNKAYAYNPFSFRIFMFFLIQLLLRIFFLFYSRNSSHGEMRYIIIPDIAISTVLFIVFFEPFWREMVRF